MRHQWAAVLVAVAWPVVSSGQERLMFKDDLLFYASYDKSVDADFARGKAQAVRAKGKGLVPGRTASGALFRRKGGLGFCEYSARGNVRADVGTIAFHFKPDWSGQDEKVRHFFFRPGARSRNAGANFPDSMGLFARRYKKGRPEMWLWCDDHGGGNNLARADISDWRKGEWRHVAVTWDPARLCIYLDGELKGSRPMRGQITDPAASFFVGASRSGAFVSEGVLDELYIYGRALSQGEIGLLTGRPELVVPRIRSVALGHTLFFQSEGLVPFRCELSGRIDSRKHTIRATLVPAAGGDAVGTAALAADGRLAQLAADFRAEGAHTLRLELVDKAGKQLDRRAVGLYVIKGPFDR